ncbi:MAG TPA: hypothetical protein VLF69_00350 [Candidatus Saccharimonadales bacterium]|nr:hypothetical protein [Candidatus Saccharimonadales bacterium]
MTDFLRSLEERVPSETLEELDAVARDWNTLAASGSLDRQLLRRDSPANQLSSRSHELRRLFLGKMGTAASELPPLEEAAWGSLSYLERGPVTVARYTEIAESSHRILSQVDRAANTAGELLLAIGDNHGLQYTVRRTAGTGLDITREPGSPPAHYVAVAEQPEPRMRPFARPFEDESRRPLIGARWRAAHLVSWCSDPANALREFRQRYDPKLALVVGTEAVEAFFAAGLAAEPESPTFNQIVGGLLRSGFIPRVMQERLGTAP